jgi:hypothetical protein
MSALKSKLAKLNLQPFETEITGAELVLLLRYQQDWEPQSSTQYILESALVAGLEAKRRSKEYSRDQRNLKEFNKAVMRDPSVMLDEKRRNALMTKYRIGATRSDVQSEIEALVAEAEADAEAAEAGLDPNPNGVTTHNVGGGQRVV